MNTYNILEIVSNIFSKQVELISSKTGQSHQALGNERIWVGLQSLRAIKTHEIDNRTTGGELNHVNNSLSINATNFVIVL